MNIIVCIKQVPDPETPSASFKIDPEANKVIPAPGITPVVDPYAENAVEAALQLKDQQGGTITAICLGPKTGRDALKHVMSMGVDEGILLDDPAFEGADAYATARALAGAMQKVGPFDLVLCGRQAADTDMGMVGCGIAELLGLPSATVVTKIQVADGSLRVERIIEDGRDIIELPLPCLLTISNEIGIPRYPTLRGIMTAAKKEVTVWTAQDLGLDPYQVGGAGSKLKLQRLYIPTREARCEFIEGDSPAEKAVNLALRLRQAKLF